MGYGSYSESSRSLRASKLSYDTAPADEIFIQNKKREIHESMEPAKALLREARDSEQHPNSFPIIFALDVTGSMGHIPVYLVREGLPKIVSGIIQHGIPDPQLLFLAVGDHECDRYPLQVGQFECGDEELDMWLTRTYIESGGGGNAGESYLLAWYFAANHTVIDSLEKRGQKGLLCTIGDEPSLTSLPVRAIQEIMGTGVQTGYSDKELLAKAQEKYDVYHIHMMEGSAGPRSLGYWKKLLGQNCIEINDQRQVEKVLIELVQRHAKESVINTPTTVPNVLVDSPAPGKKSDNILDI